MATGNIKGGKRNYAKVTNPTTSSAATSADTTSVTVTFTPSTLGPAATSFLATGTSTNGTTVTATITTSPTTVTGFTGGATYNVNFVGRNYNGSSPEVQIGTALAIPLVYSLAETFNANGTYTVPTGVTNIAAYVFGAGGGG